MAAEDDSFIAIINDACDELGIDRPLQLVGASELGDRQKCAIGNGCAKLIANEPDTGWEILQKLYTFNSVLDQGEYDLPEDYGRLTIDTVWDRAQLTPVMGPLSPALWQTIKSGLIGNGIYFSRYRVVRSQATTVPKKVFILDPPGTSDGQELVYEYQSTQMTALADLSATNATFVNDTDVFLLPRDLLKLSFKWRWRMAQGLPYTTFLEEYNQELDKYSGRDRPEPGFSMTGGRYRQNFLGWANIPDTNYGS
jgi:hypothetical protein